MSQWRTAVGVSLPMILLLIAVGAFTPLKHDPQTITPTPSVESMASAASSDLQPTDNPKDRRRRAEFAIGGADAQLRAINHHIATTLEAVRLDAVRKGDDPEAVAALFLKEEVRNWRFLSWYAACDSENLPAWQAVGRWWLHQLSTGPAYCAPFEVPGTGGLIWRVDLRDYGWNAAAWRAVALRDPYFRAVLDEYGSSENVDIHQIAILLKFLGEKEVRVTEKLLVNGEDVGVATVPAIGVMRADWMFRETIEPEGRSPAYYDLLYARARFPKAVKQVAETYTERKPYTVREWVWDASRGCYVWCDVTRYREVSYTRPSKLAPTHPHQAVIDFPRNKTDWEDFWGIRVFKDFIRKQKFDLRYGAVVPGSRDSPESGSIVTRNNRVTVFLGNGSLETIDTSKTARRNDYIEQPVEVTLGQVKGQAGELLTPLPAGGQAMLLIDGAEKRIEFATTRFVHPKSQDTRLSDVRTGQCGTCHIVHGGVIPPANQFREYLAKGIDLNIKDRIKRNQVRAFMLEWETRIAGWQAPYFRLIERSTADPVRGRKPLTPAELTIRFLELRNWYDRPVTAQQAAREYGVSVEALKRIAAGSPTARLGALAQGIAIPRDVFEADTFYQLSLFRHGYRKGKK